MTGNNSLLRFAEAQRSAWPAALSEIKAGRKQSHWMWYIFPQIKGLGFSRTSIYYGIRDIHEAKLYLADPTLGDRLVEISNELLHLKTNDATAIFGTPDDVKLKSCMTLFSVLPGTNPVFDKVLDKFFNGQKDQKTLTIIENERN